MGLYLKTIREMKLMQGAAAFLLGAALCREDIRPVCRSPASAGGFPGRIRAAAFTWTAGMALVSRGFPTFPLLSQFLKQSLALPSRWGQATGLICEEISFCWG